MRSDIPYHKRIRFNSKAITKTSRLPKAKDELSELSIMRRKFSNVAAAGFRSQFELNLAVNLKERKIPFEYEKKKLTYIPDPKTYTPDFYLVDTDIYIEAKGQLTKPDRVKMILIKKQHPDLDIRFVFMNARNKIYKGSKTTYADWCVRHGFEWAEKSIPTDWLKK